MPEYEENEDCPPLVLAVDDDLSFRTAIERQIKLMGYRVQGFSNAQDLMEYDDLFQASCIILDLAMPNKTGLEIQQDLSLKGLNIPTLFLSGTIDVPGTVDAMQGGALNVIEKPVERDTLEDAVYRAIEKSRELKAIQHRIEDIQKKFIDLTPRQKTVFEGIVAGNPNKLIAHEMGIGIRTVKAHRQQVMEKLGAKSVADLAFVAAELGLVPKQLK